MLTIPAALALLMIHLAAAVIPLAYTPGACDAGDLSCGSPALEVRKVSGAETSLGGQGIGALPKTWEILKGLAGTFFTLMTFDYPWLTQDDAPTAVTFIVNAVRGALGLVQAVIVARVLLTALGRLT